MNILGYLGGHCGSLGAPFGLILALLGRLLDPFWLSWDVLGHLGTPFSPKLAQVGPRYRKKTSIFGFALRKLAQVGSQKSRKIHAANDIFSRCIFNIDFHGFLIDFGLENWTFLGSIF